MAQSTGINKIKTAIFFSGNGSNLKSLIKFSNKKKSPIFIEMIITDNPKAKGLKFGKIFKIKSKLVNYSKKNLAEKIIISELEKYNVKFICLAGFMKIISEKFIKRFKGKILNIHPSLLPKYKGLNTHERVIKNNEKFSGCTVHFVNSNLDSGKIILQKKVRINRKDTPKKLAKKILIQEHKLYPRAIMKVLSP